MDVAQAVVGCGESSMSTGWRRISTAKMLPLSVLVLAFIVIVIVIVIVIAVVLTHQLIGLQRRSVWTEKLRHPIPVC